MHKVKHYFMQKASQNLSIYHNQKDIHTSQKKPESIVLPDKIGEDILLVINCGIELLKFISLTTFEFLLKVVVERG